MKIKWTREKLIKKYIDFFKKHNHKHIPSASLIPENDPTVLFTTAGMHPLVPFLLGQKHPLGKRLVNVQKCIRTGDIEEVGDPSHNTFFEMLGNWSLGDYWKEDAIKMSFEFLTKELNIQKERIAVTCFKGDDDAKKDNESAKIWESLGIPKERIVFMPKSDNWWGPAGQTGPCGPDTEMFYYIGSSKNVPKKFDVSDSSWLEIWNDVFMEYNKNKYGKFDESIQRNIDTGLGVERVVSVLNGLDDIYLTPQFLPIIKNIEKISGKSYKGNEKSMRVIADHLRATTFILGDPKQIIPSNVGQGYVLRRLIRRAIRYSKYLGIKDNFTAKLSKTIIQLYPDYQELYNNHKFIEKSLDDEENNFREVLDKGLKEFERITKDGVITGKEAFFLYQSYGFPIEMIQELASEKSIALDLEEYNKEFAKHQDLSRTASSGQFKSGLADNSEASKKLHTATHLLNEALRHILKDKNIKQKGSNITPERLRFDFNFDRKLTEKEINEIEDFINKKINDSLQVVREEIPLSQAIKSGAQAEFGTQYPEIVSIYTVVDKNDKKGWFSKEICTGPHVENTSELGRFKILKEESSSKGVRRIKAVLED
jgi:alanyl-tRNA synthetase